MEQYALDQKLFEVCTNHSGNLDDIQTLVRAGANVNQTKENSSEYVPPHLFIKLKNGNALEFMRTTVGNSEKIRLMIR